VAEHASCHPRPVEPGRFGGGPDTGPRHSPACVGTRCRRDHHHPVLRKLRSNRVAFSLLLPTCVMRGIITGRDVVENVGIIYREFGARCLVRLLWVLLIGKRTTFLEEISQH
jgi:hypothetical protein